MCVRLMITLRWLLKLCSNEPLEKSLICWLYLPTYLCFEYQLSTILINTGWPSRSWINFSLEGFKKKGWDKIHTTWNFTYTTVDLIIIGLLTQTSDRVRGHSVIYRAKFIPPQKVVRFCKDAIFSRIWQKKKANPYYKNGRELRSNSKRC